MRAALKEMCCVAEQNKHHHTSGCSFKITFSLLFSIMEHVQTRELHTAVGSQGVKALVGQTSNDTDRFMAATEIPHWSPSLREVPQVNNTIGLYFPSKGNLFV